MHLNLPMYPLQNIYLEPSKMDELISDTDETQSRSSCSSTPSKRESVDQQVSSRSRQKVVKGGSRSWFNKSFDQNILQQATQTVEPRTIRRQNSVTDFFQNVLSLSKSHLQDIFTPKKEKLKKKTVAVGDYGKSEAIHDLTINCPDVIESDRGWHRNPEQCLNSNMRQRSIYNSCPSFFRKEDLLTPRFALKSRGSLNRDSKTTDREKRRCKDTVPVVVPTDLSLTINMFTVTGPHTQRSPHTDARVGCTSQHKPIVKNQSLHSSTSSYDMLKLKLKSSTSSLVFPNEEKFNDSPILKSKKYLSPTAVMALPFISSNNAAESPVIVRKVSSAPSNSRQRPSSATDLISTSGDTNNKTKRALVKSNSETFVMRTSLSKPAVKTTFEDDNSMKACSTKPWPTSSITFLSNIMVSVTDYLFLGSVEAAYNERLLCRYNISSLVDITNVSPTLVPPNKKSDCPCTCVNKTHFRSKLNIGVDDIEWENLEEYFDDINTFIHGARKNGRCVLVFSYLGQSRAPTAVIQHIMQHFKLSYKTALNIVQTKRPQTKLNSGFVKSLLRLEKRLGYHDYVMNDESIVLKKSKHSLRKSQGIVGMDKLSIPPIVKGAWLEC